MIYLDANIYLNVVRATEEQAFFHGSKRLLELIEIGKLGAATSVLTFHEIKWALFKKGEEQKAELALQAIESINNHDIVPLILSMVKLGTQLQIAYGLKTHDAFHIAAALLIKAEAYITRDDKIKRKVKELPILTPEELIKLKKL
jgi:predicted nucleic acid-binding protein